MSRKDTQLQVRLSEQDKQTIAARAQTVGMSTSEFVRQMALLAAVFEVPAGYGSTDKAGSTAAQSPVTPVTPSEPNLGEAIRVTEVFGPRPGAPHGGMTVERAKRSYEPDPR